MRRRGEAAVARAAAAAVRRDEASARVREVGEKALVLVEHLCADRHAELDVVAVAHRACSSPRRGARASPRSGCWRWKKPRSRRSGSATSTTSPPWPPSPPSGPPFGTYFSRLKLSDPSPPRPPLTRIRARSWNTAESRRRSADGHVDRPRRRRRRPCGRRPSRRGWRRSCGRGRGPCPGRAGSACRAGGR